MEWEITLHVKTDEPPEVWMAHRLGEMKTKDIVYVDIKQDPMEKEIREKQEARERHNAMNKTLDKHNQKGKGKE